MDPFSALKEEVTACKRCLLHQSRNQIVFGDGNPDADIFCIGEAPGYYEDQEGKTFIGRSGELINKIFNAAGFDRQKDVFTSNIVKCRPPGNRNPKPEEMSQCLPFLIQQIEMVQPTIIILLGSVPLQTFAGKDARITKMRGKWMHWKDYQIMPTYHPSALLRNEKLKRPVWEDFKQVVIKYREWVKPAHYCKYI